ncbi:MAG: trehalose-6-phosphate synthase [Candidatus Omnitrophica bacterium]|nr:trehalose-6-phosphate synthase [Candidatus Omnitrophota bacterium]
MSGAGGVMGQTGRSEGRMIVVSNRLPFNKKRGDRGGEIWEKSAGGLITGLEPVLNETRGVWLGWDGMPSDDPDSEEVRQVNVSDITSGAEAERGEYTLACVPLSTKEFEEYYNRFSNGTLWGLFHYFFEKSHIDYHSWKTYLEVNRRFADAVRKVSSEKDVIWIQDFHLFMVPYFLRKERPEQKIHFFLHIPFPHIDIFSILPWQKHIMGSLLSCDSVGFQHKQYLVNFRGAAEAYDQERRCGVDLPVEDSPTAHTYANPIAVDFQHINAKSMEKKVVSRRDEIRKQANADKIIIGVDRIDYSKGLKQRMLGIEKLLEEHPELEGSFFYYQLVVPSREDVKSYQDLKKELDELIGRINGRFTEGLWTPIHYNYGKVPFNELIALYSAGDIALVTPLRDGMNLVCKEYIAAHSDNDGILILSKFAGAIAEIRNCLAVNPYSIEDISGALLKALQMPKKERTHRMGRMRANVKANNIQMWFRNCRTHFQMRGNALPEERSGEPGR